MRRRLLGLAGFLLSAGLMCLAVGNAQLPMTQHTYTKSPVASCSATWNPSDKTTGITLSNGNLTATDNTTGHQAVRATVSKSTGKWYFEITGTQFTTDTSAIGYADATYTLTGSPGADVHAEAFFDSDGWYYNNSQVLAATNTGTNFGIAIDFTNGKIWERTLPSGNWNNSGSGDPVGNVGGATFSVSGAVFPTYFGDANGDNATINLGASAFSGTVPTGYSTCF